jgi:hypothetical protein
MNIEEIDAEIEKQQKKVSSARKALVSAENKKFKLITEPKLKAMVGKCFKCRDSYGGGLPDWWLYTKVVGYKDQSLIVCTYELTSTNRIEVEINEKRFRANPEGDLLFEVPITKKQFNAAINRGIKKMEGLK